MSSTYSPCPNCQAINRVRLDPDSKGQPVCARCKTALQVHGAVSEVDGDGLTALIEKTSRPVVADFWAEWCGPCKAFAPTFAQVASKLGDRVTFVKLDTEADPATSQRLGIQAIPTLIRFEGGAEKDRKPGALSAPMLESWLAS